MCVFVLVFVYRRARVCVRASASFCVSARELGEKLVVSGHSLAGTWRPFVLLDRLHIVEMESKENKKRAISDGGNINYEAVVLDIEGTTTPISFVKVLYNSLFGMIVRVNLVCSQDPIPYSS